MAAERQVLAPTLQSKSLPLEGRLILNEGSLKGFKLLTRTTLPIRVDDPGAKKSSVRRPYVELEGVYSGEDLPLNFANQPVTLDKLRKFQVRLYLLDHQTPFSFSAPNASGESFEVTGALFVAQEVLDQIRKANPNTRLTAAPSSWTAVLGIGLSDVTNSQTGLQNFQEWAFTLKAGLNYPLSSIWSIGGIAYSTVLPLSSNQANIKAYFVGANARVELLLTPNSTRWRLALAGGGYYVTSFVTQNLFGPYNLFGPELFPSLKYLLRSGNSVDGYLKFAPVTSVNSIGVFSSYELAVGMAYRITSSKKSEGETSSTVSINFDFSELSLNEGTRASLTESYTVGVSYGF
jgi:hypothetical protein